jgi:hypothetical protein
MLTKWTKVGLSVDSEDAKKVNMSHKDLKVIALALRSAEVANQGSCASVD